MLRNSTPSKCSYNFGENSLAPPNKIHETQGHKTTRMDKIRVSCFWLWIESGVPVPRVTPACLARFEDLRRGAATSRLSKRLHTLTRTHNANWWAIRNMTLWFALVSGRCDLLDGSCKLSLCNCENNVQKQPPHNKNIGGILIPKKYLPTKKVHDGIHKLSSGGQCWKPRGRHGSVRHKRNCFQVLSNLNHVFGKVPFNCTDRTYEKYK